jgi:hypothetical protein
MIRLVHEANGDTAAVHLVQPQYVYSTDDTMQYIFAGEDNNSNSQWRLCNPDDLDEYGRRGLYEPDDVTCMNGFRVKHTFTFSAVGQLAPIYTTVAGLSEKEMPVETCPSECLLSRYPALLLVLMPELVETATTEEVVPVPFEIFRAAPLSLAMCRFAVTDQWVDKVQLAFNPDQMVHFADFSAAALQPHVDTLVKILWSRLQRHISYRVNNVTKRGSWVWNFVRENLGPVAAMMILVGTYRAICSEMSTETMSAYCAIPSGVAK